MGHVGKVCVCDAVGTPGCGGEGQQSKLRQRMLPFGTALRKRREHILGGGSSGKVCMGQGIFGYL